MKSITITALTEKAKTTLMQDKTKSPFATIFIIENDPLKIKIVPKGFRGRAVLQTAGIEAVDLSMKKLGLQIDVDYTAVIEK